MFRIAREMELYRRPHPINGARGDHLCGCFTVPSRDIHIIAASGEGWDHVSVSKTRATPSWDEMEWVRHKFWLGTATVMQLHPPVADYINNNPFTLHLWRPWDKEIPIRHGTLSTYRYCRCEQCKAAKREHNRQYKRRPVA